MPGLTASELIDLLDAGLSPIEIDHLCFQRWRFRHSDLTEGELAERRARAEAVVQGTREPTSLLDNVRS